MSEKTVKNLKKPRRATFGKIILFLLLFVVISVCLIILSCLIFTNGFGHFALAMENMFDTVEMSGVWDFIYKWGSKLIKIFK